MKEGEVERGLQEERGIGQAGSDRYCSSVAMVAAKIKLIAEPHTSPSSFSACGTRQVSAPGWQGRHSPPFSSEWLDRVAVGDAACVRSPDYARSHFAVLLGPGLLY